jgi:hypothetical protein
MLRAWGDFTVVVGRDNVKVADEPQQRTAGDCETNIDTVLRRRDDQRQYNAYAADRHVER